MNGNNETKCRMFDTVIAAKFARFDWEIQYIEMVKYSLSP